MKVIKFHIEKDMYIISGKNREEILGYFLELINLEETVITSEEEVPEETWDEKFIDMHEEDGEEPFKASINQLTCGDIAVLICTNDPDYF